MLSAISSHDRDNAATGVTKQLQPGRPAKLGLILPKTAMPVIPLIGTLGPWKRGHDRILPSGLRAAARPMQGPRRRRGRRFKEVVMKLYFAPGACSLSPHIVMREAGAQYDLEQVNNQEKKTKSGTDYWTINAKGQVPVLEFDNGERLTEGPVIVQWIADQNPASGLVPPAGKLERYRVQEWLNFITSELHKTFGPIFRPTTPDAFKALSKENLGKRFDWLDKQLAGKDYLMGDKFTIADAYLFTVLRWTSRIDIDLAKWPNLKAYVDRVAARPKVQEALKAEGLI